MITPIQYIVSEQGERTAVVLDWDVYQMLPLMDPGDSDLLSGLDHAELSGLAEGMLAPWEDAHQEYPESSGSKMGWQPTPRHSAPAGCADKESLAMTARALSRPAPTPDLPPILFCGSYTVGQQVHRVDDDKLLTVTVSGVY